MARIRSIKPEIRRSLVVSSWPYPVRWTFVGLPGYVDDEGRGHDNTSLIKAELYPLDDDMTARKIERHLTQIAATGPLCRYEVAGQRYLHITTWAEHQRVNRPGPSKIPRCPTHESSLNNHGTLSEPFTESSLNAHGALTDGSLPRAQARAPAEQGAGSREGSREQGAVNARGAHGDDDTITELLDEHLRQITRPVPPAAVVKIRDAITDVLTAGTSIDDTRAALAELRRRGGKPGLLPHLVADLAAVEAAAAYEDDPLSHPDAVEWLREQEAAR